jgi:hypothetical protein
VVGGVDVPAEYAVSAVEDAAELVSVEDGVVAGDDVGWN